MIQFFFYHFTRSVLFIILKIWNRLEVHGSENLPKYPAGFILAPNHVSFLDPPIVGASVHRTMVFLARESLLTIPVMGPWLKLCGVMPLASSSDFRTLRTAVKLVKSGTPTVIFPEGTRSPDGELMEAKPGIVFLAAAAKVPIIPCYIDGADEALPKGSSSLRRKPLKIFFDKPMEIHIDDSADKNEQYRRYAGEIMTCIRRMKDRYHARGGSEPLTTKR